MDSGCTPLPLSWGQWHNLSHQDRDKVGSQRRCPGLNLHSIHRYISHSEGHLCCLCSYTLLFWEQIKESHQVHDKQIKSLSATTNGKRTLRPSSGLKPSHLSRGHRSHCVHCRYRAHMDCKVQDLEFLFCSLRGTSHRTALHTPLDRCRTPPKLQGLQAQDEHLPT